MGLFRVVWEYTELAMSDIQLATDRWISFMTRAVYSHTTFNAIQYYINLVVVMFLSLCNKLLLHKIPLWYNFASHAIILFTYG